MPLNSNPSWFSISLWLTCCVFVVFAMFFVVYVRSEKQIDRANELRLQSHLLADELRHSSDDLTRMVRSYVITGNPIYKQRYQEILDIRDGRKPRPAEYQNIYWDLVMADDQRPSPSSGQSISLLGLMRLTGFTEAEFTALAQAKANSDALTRTEFAAMKLIELTGPNAEANRRKALQMLHDEAYHQAKANIMRPIRTFYQMMEQRTRDNVRAAEDKAALLRQVFVLFGLLLIFMLWRAYRALRAILGGSVDELQAHIARLGSGDFISAMPVAKGMENSVLGWLSQTQINLAMLEGERQAVADEIKTLAFHDPLTSLPNRRLMNDRLRQTMAASKRSGHYAALMFLDLDNFKTLNDEYGHDIGDLLLVEVARRIRCCVREMDTIARFGGDEFVVILTELDTDKAESISQASIVAEKIRSMLAEPYELPLQKNGRATSLAHRGSSSIGVVLFIGHDNSVEELLKMADHAMYRAKEGGRNLIRFYGVSA